MSKEDMLNKEVLEVIKSHYHKIFSAEKKLQTLFCKIPRKLLTLMCLSLPDRVA